MANVDSPPVARMPDKFTSDADVREYFIQIENILYQLWRRTGGYNDDVADTGTRELYPFIANKPAESENEQVNYDVPRRPDINTTYQFSKKSKEFNAATKSIDYTAVDNDYINAKNDCSITLPLCPAENAVVIIRNGDDSKITVKGNGKNINGQLAAIMRRKGTSLIIQYFIDSDEWFIR